jgi:NhaP-type Na+/H+ or K+/H+ antiporter
MIYQNLLVFVLFILMYGLIAKRIEKTAISGPFLAVIVGLLAGPLLLDLIDLKVGIENYRVIAELTLALVLFTDASNTDIRVLLKNVTIPSRLLLIGLPLTIAFGMIGGLFLFNGFTWLELGILSTLLAPTDAALGKPVVTNPLVPSKIRESLNVESGLNDGICVPVLFLLMALFSAQTGEGISFRDGLLLFAEEIGIGLGVGLGVTFIVDRLIHYSENHRWISKSWRTILIIALSFCCFTTAQLAGGSGFIACFTGGLLYSAINREYKHDLLEEAEGAGDTLSMFTWIIFGSVVIAGNLKYFTWNIVIYALLSLTVIRMVPVLISLIKTELTGKEKIFISWFGPRGLASIVFAIIIFDIGLPHIGTIILTAACTILLSIVLHGFSANPFIRRLNKENKSIHGLQSKISGPHS